MPALNLYPRRDEARYSLRGVFDDERAADGKRRQLAGPSIRTICFKKTAPSGTQLYHVAAHQTVERVERAGIPHEHTTPWNAVRVVVDRFRRIERTAARRGLEFRWYKPLEIDHLKACIESWHWQGTILEVAGDILTKILQVHPFPNANHRTALFLVRDYLQAAGIDWPFYSLQGRGSDRFHRDAKGFVHQSKYLLHMIRHPGLVAVASREGYTHLLLSDDVQVPIHVADVEASVDVLEGKHRRAGKRLITSLAREWGRRRLGEENTMGLKDWVNENLP